MLRRGSTVLLLAALGACACALAGSVRAQTPPAPTDGYALIGQGKFDDAVAAFRAAIAANPKDIAAHMGLGQAHLAAGRATEAVTAYREAVALNTAAPAFRIGLAQALLEAGDAAAARDQFRAAQGLSPSDPAAALGIGDALKALGRLDEARAAYESAMGWSPDNPEPHIRLGALCEQQKDWEGAASEYGAVVRLMPAAKQSWIAWIGALGSGRRAGEAERRAREALLGFPGDVDIRMALASALDASGRRTDSIKEYRAIVAQHADAAVVWGNMGWALYGHGKLVDAIESTRRAIALDKSLVYAQYNLGLFLAARSDWPAAQKAYEGALAAGQPGDLTSAIDDVRAALKKPGAAPTLRMALAFLMRAQAAKPGRLRK